MYHRHEPRVNPRHIWRAFLFCVLGTVSLSSIAAQPLPSDPDVALRWWIANAEEGRPEYQYNLGRMYETGMPALNLQPDAERAMHWYQRAAAQGHVAAQSALARLQQRRVGAPVVGETVTTPAPLARTLPTPTTNAPQLTRYWSWWQGGLVLAAISLGFWFALGTPLGVSSSWERIANWRGYRRAEAADRQLANRDTGAVADALLAETLRQFGPAALTQLKTAANSAPPRPSPKLTQLPWTTHITFLISLALGGFLAAASTETFTLKLTLGDAFTRIAGDGWMASAVLAAGGVLIGFGTRMAGGCSSGHGLTGCARLQSGSLLATASFFGSATLLTLILVNV